MFLFPNPLRPRRRPLPSPFRETVLPAAPARETDRQDAPEVVLTVLATSDMHGHLLSYDYFADRAAGLPSLSRIASHVEACRAQDPACLLVDNGDFLQGTPLADLFADLSPPSDLHHPVIEAMNALRYDAVALGNHEFNLPLPQLAAHLARAGFPLLCANLRPTSVAPEALNGLWQPHVLVDRRLRASDGQMVDLRIGLFGTAPPQVLDWDHSRVAGRIAAGDAVAAARAAVRALRADGADLVIGLAHAGLSAAETRPGMENAGRAIAAIEGLDALVLGHSHLSFPGPDQPPHPQIVPETGTVAGTPTVQPGPHGASLGRLDLTLRREAGGWRVSSHHARLIAAAALPEAPEILRRLKPAHDWVLTELRKPLGRLARPVHSYLGLLPGCHSVRMVARVQRDHVRARLRGSEWQNLPLLSASAPQRCGGCGGPGNFTHIPAGPVALSHIASLQFFPNDVSALVLSGAELADWLEMSASVYRTIAPGRQDQPLLDPAFPGYNSDTVFGLSYEIDLTQPPRHADDGRLIAPHSRRICNLTWQGAPLEANRNFILAVNNYRAGGGGNFPHIDPGRIVLEDAVSLRDLLAAALRDGRDLLRDAAAPWRFRPVPGASAVLETSPDLRCHMTPQAMPELTELGLTPDGFLRLRLSLDR